MITESLVAMIKNDLDTLTNLTQELAGHELFPIIDAGKLEESHIRIASISVARDIYCAAEHMVRLVLREIDKAADLDTDDTLNLAMLDVRGARPALLSKSSCQFLSWLAFFLSNVEERGHLITKVEDVLEILKMLPDFMNDMNKDVNNFLAAFTGKPGGTTANRQAWDLLLTCTRCDDVIRTRSLRHEPLKCQCGCTSIDAIPAGIAITFNCGDDVSNRVYIIELDEMRRQISLLKIKAELSDEEKRQYYRMALLCGDDEIGELDTAEIKRLLPELGLPRLIHNMWINYFGPDSPGKD